MNLVEGPDSFAAVCGALAGTLRSDALARRLRDALAEPGDDATRRATVVATLVEIGDLVDDETAAVRATLHRAGVEAVDVASGASFDASVQHVVGVTPTDDRSLDGLVAGTVRPGYRDGRTLLREPEVAIYRAP